MSVQVRGLSDSVVGSGSSVAAVAGWRMVGWSRWPRGRYSLTSGPANVHFYGTHSVDIAAELATLDTNGYRPLTQPVDQPRPYG